MNNYDSAKCKREGQGEEVEMSAIEEQHDHHATSTAPLIDESQQQRRADQQDGSHHSGNTFVWTLTIAACVGGLLFGYDTGVISSTLVSIGTDLSSRRLTNLDKGFITSATSFFALVASPIAGVLADRYGRKSIIIISDGLFVFGSCWQALSTSVWSMVVGRGIVGLAIGGASLIVPLYIAELSPGHLRGRLTTVQLLLITGGQAVAYVIGWLFSSMDGGWRWMVGIGAFPALTQLALLSFMPETPRFLARNGREDRASKILRKVYKGSTSDLSQTVQTVLAAIKKEIMEEEEAKAVLQTTKAARSIIPPTLRSLLFHTPHARALTIACLLQGLQQACGFNSLMYFSATIFDLLRFGSPTLTSLSVALTNFAFTVVAFYLIDRLGRRRSLLYTIPIMVIGLILCSFAFTFVELPKDLPESVDSSTADPNKIATYAILAALLIYISSYATGLGPVPWMQSELFPLQVRSLGSSISTATNWGLNTVVGLTFLPMMHALTPTWTFVCYAVICVIGWFCIWLLYPETKGMNIEDVSQLLANGWGVEESTRRVG